MNESEHLSNTPESFGTQVHVELGDRSYLIQIGSGLLLNSNNLEKHLAGEHVVLFTDDIVEKHYLADVTNSIKKYAERVSPIVVPHGEASKSVAK